MEHTGAKTIRLRWIVSYKGDDVKVNYRSRLVVREKRCKGEDGRALPAAFLFSAVSSLEGIKVLGSLMATMRTSKSDKPLHMQVRDISRARFYGTAPREIHVKRPEEGQDELCGLLVKSMYGTQDASVLWQDDHTQVFDNAMYLTRTASLALFESWCMEMTSVQWVAQTR